RSEGLVGAIGIEDAAAAVAVVIPLVASRTRPWSRVAAYPTEEALHPIGAGLSLGAVDETVVVSASADRLANGRCVSTARLRGAVVSRAASLEAAERGLKWILPTRPQQADFTGEAALVLFDEALLVVELFATR